MAQHRHPHADRFLLRLDALLVMATRLDQPEKRRAYGPDMNGLIVDILNATPRPPDALDRQLRAARIGLSRLLASSRVEIALVEEVRSALADARALLEEPALAQR